MIRFTRIRCCILGLVLLSVLALGWAATAEVVELEVWLTSDPAVVRP